MDEKCRKCDRPEFIDVDFVLFYVGLLSFEELEKVIQAATEELKYRQGFAFQSSSLISEAVDKIYARIEQKRKTN